MEWRKRFSSSIRKAVLLPLPNATGITSTASDTEAVNSVADNFVVVALYGETGLCFCRPGDEAWIELSLAWTEELNQRGPIVFQNVIWYNRQLYAVDKDYNLTIVELGLHPRSTRLNLPCPAGYDRKNGESQQRIYLVESGGELLMVVQTWSWERAGLPTLWGIPPHPPLMTTKFNVFKLDLRGHCWIKVESLGDRMLFVGNSSGISVVSASYFSGFKGNCIYFIGGIFTQFAFMKNGPKPIGYLGVYSLEEGNIKSPFPRGSHSSGCFPFWFMPSPL
ncbi:hypothetical protein L1049_005355 [Liquidambar formosana]|uniref:KIB1-4 beta-propeller domain-containing protein n=1 Tax=Liquidambar formosana TaxID=63359 RepID=A0AAP0RQG8_LIQFO